MGTNSNCFFEESAQNLCFNANKKKISFSILMPCNNVTQSHFLIHVGIIICKAVRRPCKGSELQET